MLESVHLNLNGSGGWPSLNDSESLETPHKKSFSSHPHAQIFFFRDSIGPKLINSIVYVKNLLQLKGIGEEDIEEVVLESEFDIQAHLILDRIKGVVKKDFPIISVNNCLMGTIATLEEWIYSSSESQNDRAFSRESGHLNLNNNIDAPQQHFLNDIASSQCDSGRLESIGHMDQALNHSSSENSNFPPSPRHSIDPEDNITLSRDQLSNESDLKSSMDLALVTGAYTRLGMRYVGSAISSVANYFASTPSSISSSSSNESKSFVYVEFEVIQINWYWRQQRRVLRFSNDKFFRLNPFTKELRAVHKYLTIQRIIITGKNFMTISFTDQNQPEYYQSEKISDIVQVILSRSQLLGHSIPVNYVEDS